MTTLVFIGCSQNNSKETIPESNVDTSSNLSSTDIELIEEVNANHSFDDPFIALDPYENAPLSAVVIFTTDKEMGVEIKILGHEKA